MSSSALTHPRTALMARSATRVESRLLTWFWAIGLFLLPIHILGPGKPQPGDFLLLTLASIVLVGRGLTLPRRIMTPMKQLFGFITVALTVNLAWFALTSSKDLLVATTYFIFNAIILVGGVRYLLLAGPRILSVSYKALSIALWGQIFFARTGFLGAELSPRTANFFNNANGLGYWVLATGAILMLIAMFQPVKKFWFWGNMGAVSFLIVVSYSRAALLSLAMLLAFYIIRRPSRIILLGLALVLAVPTLSQDEMWQSRNEVLRDSSAVSQIEVRQLERLIEHPEYLLIGAGDGDYLRFSRDKLEIHSSFASLWFSYGLLGIGLFGLFLITVIRAGPKQAWALLVPVLAYGLFHQSLRARGLWLLIAFLLAIGHWVRSGELTYRRIGRARRT